ncbi:hypothetical protein GCM10022406_39790 [Hymenobacter algoricola]|uniref:XRE family transcriptional regulator n=1 Tax=Hymenobacter algoricola TaxID=486267 RepID=A0ABP7NVU2_9BACT
MVALDMKINSDAEYEQALEEFLRLATESQEANYTRLIELRDAIDLYEIEQGHEPPQPSEV